MDYTVLSVVVQGIYEESALTMSVSLTIPSVWSEDNNHENLCVVTYSDTCINMLESALFFALLGTINNNKT